MRQFSVGMPGIGAHQAVEQGTSKNPEPAERRSHFSGLRQRLNRLRPTWRWNSQPRHVIKRFGGTIRGGAFPAIARNTSFFRGFCSPISAWR